MPPSYFRLDFSTADAKRRLDEMEVGEALKAVDCLPSDIIMLERGDRGIIIVDQKDGATRHINFSFSKSGDEDTEDTLRSVAGVLGYFTGVVRYKDPSTGNSLERLASVNPKKFEVTDYHGSGQWITALILKNSEGEYLTIFEQPENVQEQFSFLLNEEVELYHIDERIIVDL